MEQMRDTGTQLYGYIAGWFHCDYPLGSIAWTI